MSLNMSPEPTTRERLQGPEASMSVLECIQMVGAWKDQVRGAVSALRERMREDGVPPEEARRRRMEVEQFFFAEYIDQVISRAERYRHIFFTEHGSFYFVLQSGESMRFKKIPTEDGRFAFSAHESFCPLMRGIVFLDPAESARQKEVLRHLEYYPALTLKTVPLGIGCEPFEFEPLEGVGRRALGEDVGIVEWSDDGSELTLRGWSEQQEGDPPRGFNGYPRHLGHRVSRIIV